MRAAENTVRVAARGEDRVLLCRVTVVLLVPPVGPGVGAVLLLARLLFPVASSPPSGSCPLTASVMAHGDSSSSEALWRSTSLHGITTESISDLQRLHVPTSRSLARRLRPQCLCSIATLSRHSGRDVTPPHPLHLPVSVPECDRGPLNVSVFVTCQLRARYVIGALRKATLEPL